MLQFKYIKERNYFLISHLTSIILFAIIYYYLFSDIDTHFILNDKISKEEYLKNKIINSIYLSINMQSTTGSVDLNFKSPVARIVAIIQQFLTLIISLSVFYIVL